MNAPHEPFAWLVAAVVASIFVGLALFVGVKFGAVWLIWALFVTVLVLAISKAPTIWGRK